MDTLNYFTQNLFTFQGMTHYENQLKNGTFYTDLLIKRGSVANSQEMSIRIGDQIDETIQISRAESDEIASVSYY